METKKCTKCNVEKNLAEYTIRKQAKDGLHSNCKSCTAEYYAMNKERQAKYYLEYYKDNIEKYKRQSEKYQADNKERIAKYRTKYRADNKERIAKSRTKYREENIDKIVKYNLEYSKNRRKQDSLYRFANNVRALTGQAFKRRKNTNFRKNSKTEQLLGCSIPELRKHLEKQFQPGMSIENHGEWHIDHIIPLASASTQTEIETLCHYTNLQPLWAKDNLKKQNKLVK